jgi:hypothetical protein
MKNGAAGLLTVLATDDLAAGLLVAQNGKLVVQAFCLACGAIWLPSREFVVRSARGDFGAEVRDRTRRDLERLVKDGTGFKLMSSEMKQKSEWAQQILLETKTTRQQSPFADFPKRDG